MRKITRQVAFEGGWDTDRAEKMSDLFNSLAPEWAERSNEAREAPIADGLARGELPLDGRWLELGSGTGSGTRVLRERVDSVVACDLAAEMLANAPADLAPRVQCDASTLPFSTNRFDAVLMVNMLLFPSEVDRVIAPGGSLLWVNSLGSQTPIHLPPADVVAALPGQWMGLTGKAGSGFWLALHKVLG